MNKEEHNQEILRTRIGGFGSSDAAMFIRIAKRGSVKDLSRTDLIRIAVAMGLRAPVQVFVSEDMERGHRFEDWFSKLVTPDTEREKLLTFDCQSVSPFRFFAHADFYNDGHVWELKCSKMETDEVLTTYMPQLQWYYIMSNVTEVTLAHCQPNDTKNNPFLEEFDKVEPVFVDKDPEVIDMLYSGMQILCEAVSDGWKPEIAEVGEFANMPNDIQAAFLCLQSFERAKKDIEERIEKEKQTLLSYMQENGLATIEGEKTTVTMVSASVSKTFDSTKFFKAHPELTEEKAKFIKETNRKAYISLKNKELKN